MEFQDYIRILRQRAWIVVLLAILTAAVAFFFSRAQPKVYESSLTLLVLPSRTDFGQAEATKNLLRGYTQWMNSSIRAQRVIDQLQLDMTPDELLGSVGIASDASSYIIQMEVRNTNTDIANDIARTWGNVLIQWVEENNAKLRKEDRITVEFVDNPKYSGESPNVRVNTLAGGIFGVLVGILVIFLLEWIDSGILRRGEDIERYLEIPVVGSIPKKS